MSHLKVQNAIFAASEVSNTVEASPREISSLAHDDPETQKVKNLILDPNNHSTGFAAISYDFLF